MALVAVDVAQVALAAAAAVAAASEAYAADPFEPDCPCNWADCWHTVGLWMSAV